MYSKSLKMVLILILVVQLLPLNIAAQTKTSFKDVSEKYGEIVNQLVELGIIKGFDDSTFRPNTEITRVQAVMMIVREMKLDTSNRPNPNFKDVKPGQTGYTEIAAAADLGIINGKNDGNFDPNGKLTRAEMAKIMVEAYDLISENYESEFRDVPTNHWAKVYISTLAANGITLGYADGTFKPSDKLTRIQFTLFLSRYISEIKGNKESEEEQTIKNYFSIKADSLQVPIGQQTTINLVDNSQGKVSYKSSWKVTDGTLDVAEDQRSAVFKVSENNVKEAVVTVTIEATLQSGKKITFNKSVTVLTVPSIGNDSGIGGNTGEGLGEEEVIKLIPHQATIILSKDVYTSGEEVNVKGVIKDESGQVVANTAIELDGMRTVTDKQGQYNFSLLAIDETKEYRIYAEGNPLKLMEENGQFKDSFRIPINIENVDLKTSVIGLNSEATGEIIEFKDGERIVFKGKPDGIEKLSKNSIFLTAPNEEFPLGVIGKVVSLQFEKDETVMLISEPDLEEVFDKLEVEGTMELRAENITPGKDVTVYNGTREQKQRDIRIASEAYIGEDIVVFDLEKEILDVEKEWSYSDSDIEAHFEGEAEVYLNGKLELSKTKIEYDVSLLEMGGEIIFENQQSLFVGLVGEVEGLGEISKRLGDITIPINGPIGITGSLWLTVSADGQVTFRFGYEQQTEMKLGARASIKDGVEPISDFYTTSEFTNEIEGTLDIGTGIKPNVFISVATIEILGLDNEIGVKGQYTGSITDIGTEDQRSCLATEIFVYAGSNAAINEPIEAQVKLLDWKEDVQKTDNCPKPETLNVDPKKKLVEKGEQIQLAVTGSTEKEENKDFTYKKEGTEYETSDPKIATVSKDGLVTISDNASVGSEVEITVKNSDVESVSIFKVIEIKEVYIDSKKILLPAGGKRNIYLKAKLTNGEEIILNEWNVPIKYKVEDTDIAEVIENELSIYEGIIIGLTTTLTVSYEDYEVSVPVEVKALEGSDVTLGFIPKPPIAAGDEHTVYVKEDGTVWTWGRNNNGQLGDGTTERRMAPIQVQGLSNIIEVAAGYSHTLALEKDGTVWAWGNNGAGQLGNGGNVSSSTPVRVDVEGVKSIGAGAQSSYAILANGTVKSWGGILGNGKSGYSNVPVDVFGLTGVISIDSSLYVFGERHTVALKNDGTVWTWGDNYFGGLGTGPHLSTAWHYDALIPVQVSGPKSEGYLQGIHRIQAGEQHSLALGQDGTFYGWGDGYGDEFWDAVNHPVNKMDIDGFVVNDVKEISAGGYFYDNIIVRKDGSVWYWRGDNGLKKIPNLEDIKQVSTGGYHSYAINNDGEVWAWGLNTYGQLGNGTINYVGDKPVKIRLP